MNEKLLYEQIISEKLDKLPVPDMADAIWARIERQLDIDLPTDDGGGSPTPPDAPAGGSNLLGHIGVFVAIVALTTFFFDNKKQKADRLAPTNNLPNTEVTTAAKPPDASPPDTATVFSPPRQKNSLPALPVRPAQDSLFGPAIAAMPAPDTAVTNNALVTQAPLPATVPAAVDTVPVKRRRGVPISNADYRIVPKRDSVP